MSIDHGLTCSKRTCKVLLIQYVLGKVVSRTKVNDNIKNNFEKDNIILIVMSFLTNHNSYTLNIAEYKHDYHTEISLMNKYYISNPGKFGDL